MKRDIYQLLLEWKSAKRRKPLLLKGARQTGKTYILQEFGRKEYRNVHYFNFEADAGLDAFFQRNLDPHRIIGELSIYKNKPILPAEDLIIFDEIQASNNALNGLKYFQEQADEYHIAAAGSLLGVKLSRPKSFPVGKVNFLDLYPMTFLEFLEAVGKERYRHLLEGISDIAPFAGPFHEDLIHILKKYYFIGGMPEAVRHYVETGDLPGVRRIQREIINSYLLDFAKHAPTSDIPKLSLIWESVPVQLARENKKFIFSAIRKSARAREYENALAWLEDAGLILRAFLVSAGKYPLKGYVAAKSFKVYCLDVGILGAMADIPVEILAGGDRLFTEYKGAFTENYVARQLAAGQQQGLYYWRSRSGMAEIDFIYDGAGSIYPLEVKAGINPKSKSLKSYDQQYKPPMLLRTTLLNLKCDGRICNIPLYAINCLEKIISSPGRRKVVKRNAGFPNPGSSFNHD